MHENIIDDVDNIKMPLLVYVSRERKLSSPHHFKAGALNVLVRLLFYLPKYILKKKKFYANTINVMIPCLA
jgi:hypothetical protein